MKAKTFFKIALISSILYLVMKKLKPGKSNKPGLVREMMDEVKKPLDETADDIEYDRPKMST